MGSLPISLVIITFNEEQSIKRCIQSVPFVSEIVVIDSGSTDKTVQIARQLGARVLVESWRGYFKQKVRATAVAMNDWVLSLDADEALSEELSLEIQKQFAEGGFDKIDAFSFPRQSNYLGKWIQNSGWYPDLQVRLFNKKKCEWVEEVPHEVVKAKICQPMSEPLKRWAYDRFSDHINSLNRKTTALALRHKEMNTSPGDLSIFSFSIRQIRHYFSTKAYKDGWQGLVISLMSSFEKLATIVKFRELSKSDL